MNLDTGLHKVNIREVTSEDEVNICVLHLQNLCDECLTFVCYHCMIKHGSIITFFLMVICLLLEHIMFRLFYKTSLC